MKKQLILASASPRRSELLAQADIPFSIVLANVAEKSDASDPEGYVRELSAIKARAVAGDLFTPAVVLGADTVVAIDGQILEKPGEEAHAVKMLQLLQGRTHSVYTGVTLIDRDESSFLRETTFSARTDVTIAPMSEGEIRWYVETAEPFDKAGAYGAQGSFARFIERFDGEYSNVVGLPLHAVYNHLRAWELL